jgi:TolB-like protein
MRKPNALIHELNRRNVFKAALSYIVASWVFLQAAALIFPILNFSEAVLKGAFILLIIGFPLWLIFAYFFEITPEGLRRTEDVAPEASIHGDTDRRMNRFIIAGLSLAVVLLIVDRVFNITGGALVNTDKTKTIAVLPFSNLSPVKEDAFFTIGVHEDVMNKLSTLKGIRVLCRTTVSKYKDYEGKLSDIGKRLGAQFFLEGSVRRHQDQVRITARLVDGETDQTLWSEEYNRKLENIFELQSAIAKEIAQKMEAGISREERRRLDAVPTVVMSAYDGFLKARGMLNSSWAPYQKIMEAIELLESAVTDDPGFMQGWALLSRAQSRRYDKVIQYDGREEEAAQAKREAKEALEKVYDLGDESFEFYLAEGKFYQSVEKNPVDALKSLDKALAISPNDQDALFIQGEIFFKMGEFERMLVNLEKAHQLDPQNGMIIIYLTIAYEICGRYADMVPFFEKLLKLEPEKTHYAVQAKYYQFLADGSLASFKAFEEAVRTVEKTPQCDDRAIQDNEMVLAMFNDQFEDYTKAWAGKWDAHHAGHGNWSCPMILNDEANHAHLMLEKRYNTELAHHILEEAQNAVFRPINENSFCIFDKAVYQPKLDLMMGDSLLAREKFDNTVLNVLQNTSIPVALAEKGVLIETADMVAPDRVYNIYRQVVESPISWTDLAKICVNPWIYPNLIRDPRFVKEVKEDGRFVEFLEHYGFL